MLSWDVEPAQPEIIDPWFLWKLIIDECQQRKGYGSATVRLVADIVRFNGGSSQLLTSHVEAPGDAGAIYRRLGFEPTGDRDDHGEVILALNLDRLE